MYDNRFICSLLSGEGWECDDVRKYTRLESLIHIINIILLVLYKKEGCSTQNSWEMCI